VPGLDEVGIAMIEEALAVGVACGVDLRGAVDPDAIVRPRGGRSPGRSSMLQDVDAGRPIEVEAIVGQVQAFGREKGVPTPTIDVVLALARGLDLSLRMAR
jgi:2-dehydropantoate 2-reductase